MAKAKASAASGNDWWNTAVGGSMMMSSIGSAISVGLNVINTFYGIATGNGPGSKVDNQNTYYPRMLATDQMFTRISKYPSKTTVSYGRI